jgi:LacI family transcriptional regulator
MTAIVCANDRLAIGAIAALRRWGLDCPGDVSVTGYNDMMFADRVLPALTTVRSDQNRQGAEAAKILVEMMEAAPERLAPRHVVLPVELVIRDSTAAPGGSKSGDSKSGR